MAPVTILLVLPGQPRVDNVGAVGGGQRPLKQGLWPAEVKDDRTRVQGGDLSWAGHEAVDDLERAKPEGEQPLERQLDRRSVARRAVVEGGPLA